MKKKKNAEASAPLKTYTILMRATSAVTETMHHHLSRVNLTISQFGVLEALCHLGPLCQKELGEKILKTSGNLTMVIDNLEKRYLVKRVRDLADRRRFSVELTPEGLSLIRVVFEDHAKTASQVFGALDNTEMGQLQFLLKKLGKPAASKKGAMP